MRNSRVIMSVCFAVLLLLALTSSLAWFMQTKPLTAQSEPCTPSLVDSKVELTQAIQNDPRVALPTDNDAALVQNRRIAIRVYPVGSCSGTTDGFLRIKYNGQYVLGAEPSLNGPVNFSSNINFVFRTEHSSNRAPLTWTTVLPPKVGSSGIDFEISFDSAFSEYKTVTKGLTYNRRPRILVVPIDAQFDPPPGDPVLKGTPPASHGSDLTGGIYAVFPFEEPCSGASQGCGSTTQVRANPVFWDEDLTDLGAPGINPLLTYLQEMTTFYRPQPDWVVALTRDGLVRGVGGPSGASQRPSNNSGPVPAIMSTSSDTSWRWQLAAHEATHGLADYGWPHAANTMTNVGFDVTNNAMFRDDGDDHVQIGDHNMPGNRNGFGMENFWIALKDYNQISQYWPHNDPVLGGDPEPVWPCPSKGACPQIATRAFIVRRDSTGWRMARSYAHNNSIITPTGLSTGTGKLVLLDNADHTVATTHFDERDGVPMTNTSTLVQIPDVQDVSKVEVYWDSVLEHTAFVSDHEPTLTISNPIGSQVLTATTSIEWFASDADGDDLVYDVSFSANGFITHSLAVSLTESSYQLSSSDIPATVSGTLAVRVSDGYHTTVDSVIGLTSLLNHAPFATIILPSAGTTQRTASFVELMSSVHDYDEIWLPASAITWKSDLDGALGTGWRNRVQLSVGVHEIELAVLDSSGAQITDTTTITITN